MIELLVVVAIIGILASIAVVNFLNAQVRARVGRAQADLHAIGIAVETYYVDNEDYPAATHPLMRTDDQIIGAREGIKFGSETVWPRGQSGWNVAVPRLTTPIAYISSYPPDPFKPGEVNNTDYDSRINSGIFYDYYMWYHARTPKPSEEGELIPIRQSIRWMAFGLGPSKTFEGDIEYKWENHYDPMNGLRSHGMVVRFGP